uniref:Uncharacterized protein n=1 Tax=Anguilla anguilla TaxID=7936 RepID=A0A0E9PFF9_ANGAN
MLNYPALLPRQHGPTSCLPLRLYLASSPLCTHTLHNSSSLSWHSRYMPWICTLLYIFRYI